MRNNIETEYLIFISSDGAKDAMDIFDERIKSNLWPIYDKTPQIINLKEGKKVIFYIAGNTKNSQHFIASATIDKIIKNSESIIDPNQNLRLVKFYINFKNFLKFDKNVSVRENMDDLTFIKNKEKYGLYFQGGICKIDQTSYSYILNKAL